MGRPSCARCCGSLDSTTRYGRFAVARSVAVTFDYRCPFAYNGNLAVVNAIRGGSDIEFRFVPFSLDQVHVAEDEPAMWERDPVDWGTGMRALLYGIAARDAFSDKFFDAHLA